MGWSRVRVPPDGLPPVAQLAEQLERLTDLTSGSIKNSTESFQRLVRTDTPATSFGETTPEHPPLISGAPLPPSCAWCADDTYFTGNQGSRVQIPPEEHPPSSSVAQR